VARLIADELPTHLRAAAESHARRPLRQVFLHWLESAWREATAALLGGGGGEAAAAASATEAAATAAEEEEDEAAKAVAVAEAGATGDIDTAPPTARPAARLVANARRATVLLAEELGGLKTPTGEADYGRAVALLAPLEAALRGDPAWEGERWASTSSPYREPSHGRLTSLGVVDFVLVSGGSALKFTSLARVHLLLVVAYERIGRRAEAEALHLRGELPAQDGVWSANALAFDGPGAGPAVRHTGQAAARGAARRSLHESAVHRVEGTERPLRSQAPWQRAELARCRAALSRAWHYCRRFGGALSCQPTSRRRSRRWSSIGASSRWRRPQS